VKVNGFQTRREKFITCGPKSSRPNFQPSIQNKSAKKNLKIFKQIPQAKIDHQIPDKPQRKDFQESLNFAKEKTKCNKLKIYG
jgi:hypothetical protein